MKKRKVFTTRTRLHQCDIMTEEQQEQDDGDQYLCKICDTTSETEEEHLDHLEEEHDVTIEEVDITERMPDSDEEFGEEDEVEFSDKFPTIEIGVPVEYEDEEEPALEVKVNTSEEADNLLQDEIVQWMASTHYKVESRFLHNIRARREGMKEAVEDAKERRFEEAKEKQKEKEGRK